MLRWGDMGGQWGVNRSVAQIQALLYLSDRPLTAEDIADTLGMARSNVSNSIRELLGWKLIRRVPVLGDRRDHYEAEADLWQILTRIAQGRKEREIDPAVAAMRECVRGGRRRSADQHDGAQRAARDAELPRPPLDTWFGQMIDVPPTHAHGADPARRAGGQPARASAAGDGEEGSRRTRFLTDNFSLTEITDITVEGDDEMAGDSRRWSA